MSNHNSTGIGAAAFDFVVKTILAEALDRGSEMDRLATRQFSQSINQRLHEYAENTALGTAQREAITSEIVIESEVVPVFATEEQVQAVKKSVARAKKRADKN